MITQQECPVLETALQLGSAGIPIIPLHRPIFDNGSLIGCTCGRQNCSSPGKHPRIKDWYNESSSDDFWIRDQFTRNPYSNLGIPIGPRTGLSALDIDPRNGGKESLQKLVNQGLDLTQPPYHQTGSGGWHFLYERPEDGIPGELLGPDLPGIEVKDEGRQIVVPPSLHASGQLYQTNPGHGLTEKSPPPLPKLILDLLREHARKSRAKRSSPTAVGFHSETYIERQSDERSVQRARRYFTAIPQAIEGQRGHNQTYRAACVLMHDFWLTPEAALIVLKEWNERNQPPWGEEELEKFLQDAVKYAKGIPGRLAFSTPPRWRTEVLVPQQHILPKKNTTGIKIVEVRSIDFAEQVIGALPPGVLYRYGGAIGEIRCGEFHPLSPHEMILRTDQFCALYMMRPKREKE